MDQKEINTSFRGSGTDLRHNQDGRQQQPPPPQQTPQKCPRCDSPNTKFCYYNNYSLSQPRYFCKTCRRYWTQGGTLRNVPVGGGSRKGSKRSKNTNSAASSSTSASSGGGETQQVLPSASMSSSSPYFRGGGFLSSLAAIQSLSQNLGGGSDSISNPGFLQGFGIPPPFTSQLQAQQLFHMVGDDGMSKSLSLDNSSILHQPTRPPAPSSTVNTHNDWIHQGLIVSNVNNPRNPNSGGAPTAVPTSVDDNSTAGLWSIGTGAASTPTREEDHSTRAGSSNRWPNIPGYGPQ